VVLDVGHRVRAPRVLGDRPIVEISPTRQRIDDDVFEHSAKPMDRRMNLRFGVGRQPNQLRVAAPFEVEDPLVAPPVLVVADQAPAQVARQRRLSGAGEAEEERRVPLRTDVGGAVHREHATVRQHAVQDGKHRLLDLARVGSPADEHEPPREMNGDARLGSRRVARRVSAEARGVHDREIGRCRVRIAEGTRLEHRASEEAVPGSFGHDAHGQFVAGIGAGAAILHEHIVVVKVVAEVALERAERVLADGTVDGPPPDAIPRAGVVHDELVVRGTPGMRRRAGDKSAGGRECRFLAPKGFFVERCGSQVPEHMARIEAVEAEPGRLHGGAAHGFLIWLMTTIQFTNESQILREACGVGQCVEPGLGEPAPKAIETRQV
jgi:hypothetical protein